MSAGPTIGAASDPTTEAEWAARCDLAALYRVFHHLGIAEFMHVYRLHLVLPSNWGAKRLAVLSKMIQRIPSDSLFLITHEKKMLSL